MENESDINNKELLNRYEKIGNTTINLIRYGSILLTIALILFLIVLYFAILNAFFTTNIDISSSNPLIFGTFIAMIITLFSSLILGVSGRFYEYFKKYELGLIVKLYFYELAKNPEIKRKNKILKHLAYNLTRVEQQETRKKLNFIKPYTTQYYSDIIYFNRKLIEENIKKVISVLRDSMFLLNFKDKDIVRLLQNIGDCFEKKKYGQLARIFKKNEKLLSDLDELKKEITIKSHRRKIKQIGRWFASYGHDLVKLLILVIGTIILFLSGTISFPNW